MRLRKTYAQHSLSISIQDGTGISRAQPLFQAHAATTFTMQPRTAFPSHTRDRSDASFMTIPAPSCCNTRFDLLPDFRKRPFSTLPVVKISSSDRLFKSAFSKARINENLSRSDIPTEWQAVERVCLPHREGTQETCRRRADDPGRRVDQL